jgi:CheY-like chemotaxis protein
MRYPGLSRIVLVVEDDVDVRDALGEALQDSGYVAYAASNGREALAWLRTGAPSPCLILLDIMMPVMDGLQFRAVQQQDPALAHIPVVVLSAHTSAPELARQMGALGYLKKPIELDMLLSTVCAACNEPAHR